MGLDLTRKYGVYFKVFLVNNLSFSYTDSRKKLRVKGSSGGTLHLVEGMDDKGPLPVFLKELEPTFNNIQTAKESITCSLRFQLADLPQRMSWAAIQDLVSANGDVWLQENPMPLIGRPLVIILIVK
jgi:hypothetical protein